MRTLPIVDQAEQPAGDDDRPRAGAAAAPSERVDAQKNRARILDAARKLMKRRPLDEICMDELAKLAGVGKGTIYRRFADKAALLHALLDDDERALQADVQRTFARRDLSACEKLRWLLGAQLDFVVDHAAVLAAAEASARGAARLDSAPYVWRHTMIKNALVDSGRAQAEHADCLADMLLSAMSPVVVARALSHQPEVDVRSQTKRFFEAVVTVTTPAALPS